MDFSVLAALGNEISGIINLPFGANYVGALIALLASFILAKIVSFVFEKILPHVVGKTKTDVDDRIIAAVKNPVYYGVLLGGVYAAAKIAGIQGTAEMYFERSISSIIVLVIAIAVYRVINILVEFFGIGLAARTKTSVDDHLLPFMKGIVKIGVLVVAFLQIMTIWDKDITPLLASAGIAGLAVAFAAKDTLANMLGGVSIYFDKPFRIGDRIQLETGEVGDVYEIGIRSTRIKTFDDTVIIVPNEKMAASKIINYNLPMPRTNVKIKIGVAYGSDVAKVKKTLLKVADSAEAVLKDPVPSVAFTEHGDFSLNFLLTVWVADPTKSFMARDQLNEGIDREFRKEKIEIPFPTYTIYRQK